LFYFERRSRVSNLSAKADHSWNFNC